ncbi:cation-efflux pump FieF [Pseudoalteromonas sp. S3260]|jgi:ferrous-iron efflux pump FieF|uniref:cation diffusion facilitator family transporter n=1 Tax=Pseudoalteromonas TaxID=53246 RepID=UPI0004AC6144|nr:MULTISPECIES: cation diffusion facilitator family transporter [Pseudoalteromonas]MAY59823.1 divalent metal cation transporter FieF [Pseudoalteromonas sp.]QWF34222.1 cation diffusion facilitator family transporter [Pseudoalteromonas sp. SiA1]MBT2152855.1 cation diffusion facilitator family transporter [Pseudoalteromonas tetraodonis]MDN3393941.1 cation diffusion facilitator family transporter [Pseudoalteromonas sp. APC 3215]MDN3405493.1 cation diffusion facilitator family transporter [Pseudoa
MVMVSLMIATKAWAWLASGSASMLGSLTDSLMDITATLMSFLVLSYALRPADDDHRFGHGKAEALAGLGQAAFIAGSGCLLMFHGIERLINPVELSHSLLGVWVSIFAIACTLVIVFVQNKVVKHTESIAIKADSVHYKGDLILNAAVLLAILLAYYGVLYADPLFAIGVAGYLLYNSWDIATESASHLMDKELPDEEKQSIFEIARNHNDVYGVHGIRTRQGGKVKFIQLHLELDDNLPLIRAHKVADEVELMITQQFESEVDILIHLDPLSLSS